MDFDYTAETSKDFDAAVSAVQEEIAKAGFRVLHVHDVRSTLAEKGFAIEPMKIVEFCDAKSAYGVLTADPKIGLCLPCKILVYTKDGGTMLSAMRPTVLPQFFPRSALGRIARRNGRTCKSRRRWFKVVRRTNGTCSHYCVVPSSHDR